MTFLFTDIEGSTRLLQHSGDLYPSILEAHHELMRHAISASGGVVVRTEGDSFFAVFDTAASGLEAVVAAQRLLAAQEFPAGARVRVRMGLHTGNGVLGGDDYIGIDVHRAARIAAAGNGGQILLSAATAGLVEQSLPADVQLRDLSTHNLKDLSHPEHIYQATITGLPDVTAPLSTSEAVRHNLPTRITSFVGRDNEVAAVTDTLQRARLVTLTGPGGTGKTRLALEVAATFIGTYSDGVWFVELAPVSDPSLVPAKVLESFPGHIAESGVAPEELLIDYMSAREMLLVLDNFEQVVAAAPIVPRVLQASPSSKVLVTSRVPLRVAGEQEMEVPPLEAPDRSETTDPEALAKIEAVALFVERSASIRPGFRLDASNAAAVAELTNRLDGLPLALELAAARVRVLPVQAILENLGLRILSGGPRDLPARQQTLHNAIEWSYDLLSPASQHLFDRMSVFAGGAALGEIEAVCGDGLAADLLDSLQALVEHSLVRSIANRVEPRFRMLETIRQFGRERLSSRGEADVLQKRHADVYAALAAEAEPHLTGSERSKWLDRLTREHDNLRLAISWAMANGETDMACKMAAGLWRFFHMRGHLFAARELLDDLLAGNGASPACRAKALEAAGGVAYWSGDMATARGRYAEALEIQRNLGDREAIAFGLYNLGFVWGYGADPEEGRALLEQALQMFVALDHKAGIATATWGLGDAWAASGDLARARDCFARSIIAFEKLDDPFGLGWALFAQGDTLVRLGENALAEQYLLRGLEIFGTGDVSAVVLFLAAFAALAVAAGEEPRAMRLAGAMTGLRDETGIDLVRVGVAPVSGVDEATLASLEGELADHYAAGRAMSVAEAVAYALGERAF